MVGVSVGMVHERIDVGYRQTGVPQSFPDVSQVAGREMLGIGVRDISHNLYALVAEGGKDLDGLNQAVSEKGIGAEGEFHGLVLFPLSKFLFHEGHEETRKGRNNSGLCILDVPLCPFVDEGVSVRLWLTYKLLSPCR